MVNTNYCGKLKSPLTITVLRSLLIAIESSINGFIMDEYEKHPVNDLYRQGFVKCDSNLYVKMPFMHSGEERTLSIFFSTDDTFSISMDASGCAPGVMAAIKSDLLELDLSYLEFTANDFLGNYETLKGDRTAEFLNPISAS